ncbi:MAG: PilZ domain-containing protein [Deltaproteobacteria bacterium]|nr:PilZ domain-containing protein [Deltaproteobacteria bacterium]
MIDKVKVSGNSEAMGEKINTVVRCPDRRQYPRFRPKKIIYVFQGDFGKIIDISMGGLLFTYIFDKESLNEETPDKGVLFFSSGGRDDYIDSIPFTTVSDSAVPRPRPLNSCVVMQRRIAFGKLTENQTERLERLLLKHISLPRFAGKAYASMGDKP